METGNDKYLFCLNYKSVNAAFFCINKVATQSLIPSFEQVFKEEGVRGEIPGESVFKFAFVRNPYDRLVSCWLNQMFQPTAFSKIWFENGMHKAFWRYPELKPNMDFKSFVKIVCNIADERSNPHFKSQSFFITDPETGLIPDYIGRFERLQEDFNVICRRVDREPIALPHKNKTAKRKGWHKYYNAELRNMVFERYKQDFELFGYVR